MVDELFALDGGIMQAYCRSQSSYVVAYFHSLIQTSSSRFVRRMMLFCFLLLLFCGGSATAGEVWIKSFTGQPTGTSPNGYRYDSGVFGQDIQVIFNYDNPDTLDMQLSINGGPYNSGFSCFWDEMVV